MAPSGVKTGADAYAKALEEGEKLLKRGKYRKAVADFAVAHTRAMLKLLDAIPYS